MNLTTGTLWDATEIFYIANTTFKLLFRTLFQHN